MNKSTEDKIRGYLQSGKIYVPDKEKHNEWSVIDETKEDLFENTTLSQDDIDKYKELVYGSFKIPGSILSEPSPNVKGNKMPIKTEHFNVDNIKNGAKVNEEAQKEIENINQETKINFRGKTYDINPAKFYHNDYVFDPKHINAIKVILNSIENGHGINVLALGDAGTGKTTFMRNLAGFFGFDVFYMNCAVNRNPIDWFGQREIQEGVGTNFVKSPFANFIESASGSVILDELNRTDEENRGSLLPLMDDTRRFNIQNNWITRNNNMVFYATANIGYEYTGTTTFDKAEFDRFHIYLQFDQMTQNREEKVLVDAGTSEDDSKLIVANVKKIREMVRKQGSEIETPFSLGVRKSLHIAHLVNCGVDIKDAIKMAIIDGLNDDDRVAFQNLVARENY